MRAIDLEHLGTPKTIAAWEVDDVIIDPGPEASIAKLLAARPERPRAVLLTHIHFDHAGGTGALVRRWPDLPVFVHERGARHMADPERLVASATRLYGEEGMKRLWGEVVPVPAENMTALEGGETILDGAFRVAYTPGHASHHVSFLHQESGRAFVGDVGGVSIPPGRLVIAPTPPPDIDIEAWERSLQAIEAWSPDSLGITHFGAVDDPAEQLAAVREALRQQIELAATHDLEGFVEAIRRHVAANSGEEAAASYEQAAPFDHLWLGLDRWRGKQAEAAGS